MRLHNETPCLQGVLLGVTGTEQGLPREDEPRWKRGRMPRLPPDLAAQDRYSFGKSWLKRRRQKTLKTGEPWQLVDDKGDRLMGRLRFLGISRMRVSGPALRVH
jgi:hypothetical protein